MNKEEVLFQKRMQDLAKTAYSRGIPVFSDFLGMYEISMLHSMTSEFSGVRLETYGGYEFAERQMAMFVSDAFFYDSGEQTNTPYPIEVLHIRNAHKKFGEQLTHRDYLGALIGLGIERSQLGDIVISKGQDEACAEAYVFCTHKMADFIVEELRKVRNTLVTVKKAQFEAVPEVTFKEVKGSVASLRADGVVAFVYKLSRSHAIELFQGQKVFVNGKLMESNSHLLKEGDIVSVRGFGRFIFEEVLSMTKKERYYILVKVFT